MNTINVNVYSGNYIIETAEVTLFEGKIFSIELLSGKHHPVKTSSIETTRQFWKSEYERLGWDIDDKGLIGKAIGTHLVPVEDTHHESEDAWIDAAYEDRFADSAYFE